MPCHCHLLLHTPLLRYAILFTTAIRRHCHLSPARRRAMLRIISLRRHAYYFRYYYATPCCLRAIAYAADATPFSFRHYDIDAAIDFRRLFLR